jgi:FkbM family methyltransferase
MQSGKPPASNRASTQRRLPRGVDLFHDIGRWLPRLKVEMIFDVGAHVGGVAEACLTAFPDAQVRCFEPSVERYGKLALRFANSPRVKTERLALGSRAGTAALINTAFGAMSYLEAGRRKELPAGVPVLDSETVEVTTLDDYRTAAGIARIDILKIDTEGHDLDVLMGAAGSLSEARAGLVLAEVSMDPDNKFHVAYEEVTAELLRHDYRLFALYTQQPEMFTGSPALRRVDAAYISPKVIDENRVKSPAVRR